MTSLVASAPPQYLTTSQAAEYIGMPLQTLYNQISLGAGPRMLKRGSRNAFRAQDLDEWMASRLDQPR
ncbi:hypothetical protein GCM10010921_19880 [Microbacterium album]|uniref:Helix-turn-helix domain-containing protein n=1 Tax=Microbacterium album TaxID=2053191 RepID=A0A917IGT0_9MICO|nr:hypothetical protein GCM10010921_19880 [Microbacterium album]